MSAASVRYAKALLQSPVTPQEFLREARPLIESGPLWRALCSPCVGRRVKSALLERVLPEDAGPGLRRFFTLLVEKGRISELPDILASYQRLLLERENASAGILRCAFLPDQEQLEKIRRAACEKYRRSRVELRVCRDETLIGGFVLELDGTVWDQSVRGRLLGLQRRLSVQT